MPEDVKHIDANKAAETLYQEYKIQNPDEPDLPWQTWDDVPGELKNLFQYMFCGGFGLANHLLGNEGKMEVQWLDEEQEYAD